MLHSAARERPKRGGAPSQVEEIERMMATTMRNEVVATLILLPALLQPMASARPSCRPKEGGWYLTPVQKRCFRLGPLLDSRNHKRRTWLGARSYCDSIKAQLAAINTAEDQRFIESILGNSLGTHRKRGVPQAWIGGSGRWIKEEGSDPKFWWDWGRRLSTDGRGRYTNWLRGEPNDGGAGENCMTVVNPNRSKEAGWGWNDTECENHLHFICMVYYG